MSIAPKFLEGKRTLRRDLAALPVVEKLRLLDALRARELAIRGNSVRPGAAGALQKEAGLPVPRPNDAARKTGM